MTDAVASQAALIAVINETAQGAKASQAALVVVCNDVPPLAAGAKASQTALICVTYEYEVINKPRPFYLYSIWGFPYYVERTTI